MLTSNFKLMAAGLLAVLASTTLYAQSTPIKVERYDDADDYLPSAERKNTTGQRLFLRQQDGEELFKALSPRNVTIDVVSKIPSDADMGVVLLVGGTSVLSIVNDKLDRSFSFQTRTRDMWWPHKIATFVVDAPSDRLGKDGIQDAAWRAGTQHEQDLRAVLQAIGERFKNPLVIHGHSNGAVSAAAVARIGPPQVKAIVYSSASHFRRNTNLIYEVEHSVPLVFVQHRKDVCNGSPTSEFETLQRLIKAQAKQTIWMEGGATPFSGPCGPYAQHSFIGIEKQTIEQTATALRAIVKP